MPYQFWCGNITANCLVVAYYMLIISKIIELHTILGDRLGGYSAWIRHHEVYWFLESGIMLLFLVNYTRHNKRCYSRNYPNDFKESNFKWNFETDAEFFSIEDSQMPEAVSITDRRCEANNWQQGSGQSAHNGPWLISELDPNSN